MEERRELKGKINFKKVSLSIISSKRVCVYMRICQISTKAEDLGEVFSFFATKIVSYVCEIQKFSHISYSVN